MGDPPAQYLAVYEFEGEDAEEAERALGAYQEDPNGWSGRQPSNDSMGVIGAGWYVEELSFGTDA